MRRLLPLCRTSSGTLTPAEPERPELLVEVRQRRGDLAADADHDVAALDACLLRGALRRDAAHHQAPAISSALTPSHGLPGPDDAAVGEQIAEDRHQEVDRHEHVAGAVALLPVGVADDQRADADQLALAVDQRGAAPRRMRRRGEDRPVDQIFPAARRTRGGSRREPAATMPTPPKLDTRTRVASP